VSSTTCATDRGRGTTFVLVVEPITLNGGIGAPPNATAIT
jgi:hypothetical protein